VQHCGAGDEELKQACLHPAAQLIFAAIPRYGPRVSLRDPHFIFILVSKARTLGAAENTPNPDRILRRRSAYMYFELQLIGWLLLLQLST